MSLPQYFSVCQTSGKYFSETYFLPNEIFDDRMRRTRADGLANSTAVGQIWKNFPDGNCLDFFLLKISNADRCSFNEKVSESGDGQLEPEASVLLARITWSCWTDIWFAESFPDFPSGTSWQSEIWFFIKVESSCWALDVGISSFDPSADLFSANPLVDPYADSSNSLDPFVDLCDKDWSCKAGFNPSKDLLSADPLVKFDSWADFDPLEAGGSWDVLTEFSSVTFMVWNQSSKLTSVDLCSDKMSVASMPRRSPMTRAGFLKRFPMTRNGYR